MIEELCCEKLYVVLKDIPVFIDQLCISFGQNSYIQHNIGEKTLLVDANLQLYLPKLQQ